MILDTSAIVTILKGEPEAREFSEVIERAPIRRVSAATFVEMGLVIDGSGDPILSRRFDDFCKTMGLIIEPFTEAQARLAREAYRDFGRGSGRPAQLNFGDCFAYALARDLGEPLLFKGADFTHTDAMSALG